MQRLSNANEGAGRGLTTLYWSVVFAADLVVTFPGRLPSEDIMRRVSSWSLWPFMNGYLPVALPTRRQ
jgi:hypothetical protein